VKNSSARNKGKLGKNTLIKLVRSQFLLRIH
jgi:hypothetical protein